MPGYLYLFLHLLHTVLGDCTNADGPLSTCTSRVIIAIDSTNFNSQHSHLVEDFVSEYFLPKFTRRQTHFSILYRDGNATQTLLPRVSPLPCEFANAEPEKGSRAFWQRLPLSSSVLSLMFPVGASSACGTVQDICQLRQQFSWGFSLAANADSIRNLERASRDLHDSKETIVLLTANPLADDVDYLSDWPRRANIIAVNLGEQYADFRKWIDNGAQIFCKTEPSIRRLSEEVAKSLCSKYANPNFSCPMVPTTNGTLTSSVIFKTTSSEALSTNLAVSSTPKSSLEPTAHSSSSTRSTASTVATSSLPRRATSTTTQPTTISSTPPIIVSDKLCECRPQTMWNDIILIIESTSTLGKNTFDEVESTIKLYFKDVNIGLARNATRIGVVVYANAAYKVANLLTFTSFDKFRKQKWPFLDGDGTSLSDAVNMARDMFFEGEYRPTARRVILLLAKNYKESSEDPVPSATEFKYSGGILVAAAIGSTHGRVMKLLQNISSDGYFMQLNEIGRDDIMQALCDANCFCLGQSTYAVSSGARQIPDLGCFANYGTDATYALASNFCVQLGGTIAMPMLDAQQRTIFSHIEHSSKLYIGLIRSEQAAYHWADGTPFNGTVVPIDNLKNGCAVMAKYVEFNLQRIEQHECNDGAACICQNKPCSTTNFCA